MSHEIQILPSLLAADCIEIEENEDVIRAVFGDAPIAMHRRIPGTDPGDGFFTAVIQKNT